MGLGDLISSLKDNPYFGAGFGLLGVGLLASVGRKGVQFGGVFLRRRFMVTLEVPNKDKSYQWLLQWIATKGTKTQHLSVNTTFHQTETGRIMTRYDFVPGPGAHFFAYKNHFIRVERKREKNVMDVSSGTPFESVVLTTIGRKREIFFDILEDARQLALQREEGKTVTYIVGGSNWRQFGYPRRKRPLNSVVLDSGVSERIINDAQDFAMNQEWYTNRGIPYRRGYILYGPPGCGKSSALDYSICVLNLHDMGMADDRLHYLLSIAPERSIILLEDIDAVCFNRDLAAQNPTRFEGMGKLTLSGLLNALDGVTSSEGRLIFMTTNYIERLDSALIRPGRADVKEYIGYASDHQISVMFRRFYPDQSDSVIGKFVTDVRQHKQDVSVAQLQGLFLQYKDDPIGVCQNTHQLWSS
ncbi:hypothetical protein FSP39_014256 [Pinctada imbricata]|uniref:Mitochondrial chaperone BCS1 n=1 Tax=Pinctada imbricata TaxID=66713 RepID=A0AA89BS10_PINIB|nr:hypothetical protein FSP39_014256 [Pinctada imbricata]